MKRIRVFSAWLTALALLFAFAACAGEAPSPSASASDPESRTETAASGQSSAAASKTPVEPTPTPTSDDTPTPDETPTPTHEEMKKPVFLDAQGEPVDFKSAGPQEISFMLYTGENSLSQKGDIYRSIALSDDADMSLEVNAALKKRNDALKEELGATFKIVREVSVQGMVDVLASSLSSGVYQCDVYGLYQYFDAGFALKNAKSFYNFSDMPQEVSCYIDPSAPYWSAASLDAASPTDPQTGTRVSPFITGDLALKNADVYVSFVNKRLWNEFSSQIALLDHSGGSGDLEEIVRGGFWTLDLWKELADLVYKDTNKNKEVDIGDRLGVVLFDQSASLDNISAEILYYGAHCQTSETDEDGLPVMTLNSARNLQFFFKLMSLYQDTNCCGMNDSDLKHVMKVFREGNAMITVGRISEAGKYLSDMNGGYDLLPLPMLDHEQFDASSASLGYAGATGDDLTQFAIPVSIGADRLPIVSAALELAAYYSAKWSTPAYYNDLTGGRYESDPFCKGMIELARKGVYTSFGNVYSHELSDVIWVTRLACKDLNRLNDGQKSATGKLNKLLTELFGETFTPRRK